MRKEETVKLISAEGFEFVIDMEAAMYSHTIRQMLTSPGGFAESHNREVRFPEIGTSILEKVCQYFYWALHHQGQKSIEGNVCLTYEKWAIDEFFHDGWLFFNIGEERKEFPIDPEMCLELMMAANYLHA